MSKTIICENCGATMVNDLPVSSLYTCPMCGDEYDEDWVDFDIVLVDDEVLEFAIEEQKKRIKELESIVQGYREWIAKHVEPMRQLAMDISLKYEPCGYYCDPDDYVGGHHDHQLFNTAKFLYGDGVERYTPEDIDDLLRNAQ